MEPGTGSGMVWCGLGNWVCEKVLCEAWCAVKSEQSLLKAQQSSGQ